ncbi:hypothetical protein BT67DRAFT_101145 [Trichocladium antarcticum]|uniref:Uncharacterized protein n=1 Tax=Trichocladium antarcticum TaxID=1450529 RepID=A0AAN6ZFJ4_9PEZI|nr:hypothetical protein BT67DRAFT_101145 [Trichocladium antarcticum]
MTPARHGRHARHTESSEQEGLGLGWREACESDVPSRVGERAMFGELYRKRQPLATRRAKGHKPWPRRGVGPRSTPHPRQRVASRLRKQARTLARREHGPVPRFCLRALTPSPDGYDSSSLPNTPSPSRLMSNTMLGNGRARPRASQPSGPPNERETCHASRDVPVPAHTSPRRAKKEKGPSPFRFGTRPRARANLGASGEGRFWSAARLLAALETGPET